MNLHSPTAYVRSYSFCSSCWMEQGSSMWYLSVLVVAVMIVNLVFVINVIRVIKRRRNLQADQRNHQG